MTLKGVQHRNPHIAKKFIYINFILVSNVLRKKVVWWLPGASEIKG